jgi:hypothetical protein
MSKEISFFTKKYQRDRQDVKALVERLLPPERIKKTKGLIWVDDEAIAVIEQELEQTKATEQAPVPQPETEIVLIRPGAKNPRFEYAQTMTGEKIGVLIPSRAKGRYVGRRVVVEVVKHSDGVATYRLQCPTFQNL